MKRPGIKAQMAMVQAAMNNGGYRLIPAKPDRFEISVPVSPESRYITARFDVWREAGKTAIRPHFGLYVRPVFAQGDDPVDVYNELIELPVIKTTIAIAFGFEPIPTPWKK